MIEGDFDKSEQYFRLNMRKFDNLRLSKLVLTNCKSYFAVGCEFLLFSKFKKLNNCTLHLLSFFTKIQHDKFQVQIIFQHFYPKKRQ